MVVLENNKEEEDVAAIDEQHQRFKKLEKHF